MKINELEKIVNDGLVKYKAYKDADDALRQVKSLSQATEDLGKTVAGLGKDRDALLSEVSKLKEKISTAEKKATEIEEAAKVKALTIIERAELEAKSKIDAATAEATKQKAIEVKATADAKAALENLSGIQTSLKAAEKEWAATQAKFKAVVGG
jgi:predicted  nucleic acid-binding Zn-ribbon protein